MTEFAAHAQNGALTVAHRLNLQLRSGFLARHGVSAFLSPPVLLHSASGEGTETTVKTGFPRRCT
jgi:hypothetical protein